MKNDKLTELGVLIVYAADVLDGLKVRDTRQQKLLDKTFAHLDRAAGSLAELLHIQARPRHLRRMPRGTVETSGRNLRYHRAGDCFGGPGEKEARQKTGFDLSALQNSAEGRRQKLLCGVRARTPAGVSAPPDAAGAGTAGSAGSAACETGGTVGTRAAAAIRSGRRQDALRPDDRRVQKARLRPRSDARLGAGAAEGRIPEKRQLSRAGLAREDFRPKSYIPSR